MAKREEVMWVISTTFTQKNLTMYTNLPLTVTNNRSYNIPPLSHRTDRIIGRRGFECPLFRALSRLLTYVNCVSGALRNCGVNLRIACYGLKWTDVARVRTRKRVYINICTIPNTRLSVDHASFQSQCPT